MTDKKILIIGKLPPPIGGVTIHVKRLLDSLEKNEIGFRFENATKKNILKLLLKCLFRKQIIHLHTSSPILHFLISLANLLNKESILIITYHGNIGGFNAFKNWMDKTSIKLTDIPIVLNEESLKFARSFNNEIRLVPAFIPPIHDEFLPFHIQKKVKSLKEKFQIVFCTNAFNVSFDKNRNEIYCGSQLLNLFCNSKNQNFGFIFSDPSGSYTKHIEKSLLKLTDNILLISEPHSFFEILKDADCFIRATTTDGDPLSVKEALFLDKIVFASNVIKRPVGVYTFSWSKTNELQDLILQFNDFKKNNTASTYKNGAIELINLYKKLCKQ